MNKVGYKSIEYSPSHICTEDEVRTQLNDRGWYPDMEFSDRKYTLSYDGDSAPNTQVMVWMRKTGMVRVIV